MSQNETTATLPPENFHLMRLRAKIEALRKSKASSAKQRATLALELEEIIKSKAKERQRDGGKNKVPQNSAEPSETREKLAKVASVSHDTISEVEEIPAFKFFHGRCMTIDAEFSRSLMVSPKPPKETTAAELHRPQIDRVIEALRQQDIAAAEERKRARPWRWCPIDVAAAQAVQAFEMRGAVSA